MESFAHLLDINYWIEEFIIKVVLFGALFGAFCFIFRCIIKTLATHSKFINKLNLLRVVTLRSQTKIIRHKTAIKINDMHDLDARKLMSDYLVESIVVFVLFCIIILGVHEKYFQCEHKKMCENIQLAYSYSAGNDWTKAAELFNKAFKLAQSCHFSRNMALESAIMESESNNNVNTKTLYNENVVYKFQDYFRNQLKDCNNEN